MPRRNWPPGRAPATARRTSPSLIDRSIPPNGAAFGADFTGLATAFRHRTRARTRTRISTFRDRVTPRPRRDYVYRRSSPDLRPGARRGLPRPLKPQRALLDDHSAAPAQRPGRRALWRGLIHDRRRRTWMPDGGACWPRRRPPRFASPSASRAPAPRRPAMSSSKNSVPRARASARNPSLRSLRPRPSGARNCRPNPFEVTRQAGTERAFSGAAWNQHAPGLYRCICCDTALFNSQTKFEFRHRLAELLAADRQDKCDGKRRPQLRLYAHGRLLRPLRRPSRPCLRRRPEADGSALLHELGRPALRPARRSRLNRRSRRHDRIRQFRARASPPVRYGRPRRSGFRSRRPCRRRNRKAHPGAGGRLPPSRRQRRLSSPAAVSGACRACSSM